MSVWKIALVMGYERCCSMLKSFEYITYETGEDIIVEGTMTLSMMMTMIMMVRVDDDDNDDSPC